MKRLRPINEESRLRRLYSFSRDEYIPRKARRWRSYSSDALDTVQKMIGKVATPIVKGEALEILVEELESVGAVQEEEERLESNRLSRSYFSYNYNRDIEPADPEIAEKFEKVLDKYLSTNRRLGRSRRFYNNNEADLKDLLAIMQEKQEEIFNKYQVAFYELHEGGFLLADGSVVIKREGLSRQKRQLLTDETDKIVKVLTPKEFRILFPSIIESIKETRYMLKQKFEASSPEVYRKYTFLSMLTGFVGLAAIFGLFIYGQMTFSNLTPAMEFFKPLGEAAKPLVDVIREVLVKLGLPATAAHKRSVLGLASAIASTIIVLSSELAMKRRTKLLKDLQNCIIEVSKIIVYVAQQLSTVHELIREAIQAANVHVDKSLQELEEELKRISELGPRFYQAVECLGLIEYLV